MHTKCMYIRIILCAAIFQDAETVGYQELQDSQCGRRAVGGRYASKLIQWTVGCCSGRYNTVIIVAKLLPLANTFAD